VVSDTFLASLMTKTSVGGANRGGGGGGLRVWGGGGIDRAVVGHSGEKNRKKSDPRFRRSDREEGGGMDEPNGKIVGGTRLILRN